MRRALSILPALCALALAACGGDGADAPAQAPPAARFGPDAVRDLLAVERVRARLVPASDLYAVGRVDDALAQLRAGRELWRELSGEVRGRDPVLEREISVAFARVERAMLARTTFDTVRDRLSPLGAQLLGGAAEALLGREARFDPAVNAAVLTRLLAATAGAYREGVRPGGELRSRLALEHSFGLLSRAQAGARGIAAELGPERDAVVNGLKDLRGRVFPEGELLPPSPPPPAELTGALARVRDAVDDRF